MTPIPDGVKPRTFRAEPARRVPTVQTGNRFFTVRADHSKTLEVIGAAREWLALQMITDFEPDRDGGLGYYLKPGGFDPKRVRAGAVSDGNR